MRKRPTSWIIDPDALKGMLIVFYLSVFIIDLMYFRWYLNPSLRYEALWLWPAAWIEWLPTSLRGIGISIFAFLAFAIHLLCAIFPEKRTLKILGFIGFLVLVAIQNSFGKINHHLHGVLYLSFAAIFMHASYKSDPRDMRAALWFAQGLFLATYSLSGIWKLLSLLRALASGVVPNPLASHLQWNQIQTFSMPTGNLFFEIPFISLMLWGAVIFFEIFCISAIFFPRWLKPVALGLLLLHASTALVMDIQFNEAILMAVIFLYNHPWRVKPYQPAQAL